MPAISAAPARNEHADKSGSVLDDILEKQRPYERPELAQMRMENETILAECRIHPRNFDTIKHDLLEQLKAFPELATDAIYEKPVGKDPQTGQQKYARGLSIRAAEALAEAYGYNRIRSDVSEIDGDKVKVEATFTDYQKGRVWQDAGILSKTYKDRYGKPARWNDDRFYNVVVKAEVSKRIREVIVRSVNTGLKAWFESECEKLSAGLLDDGTIAKIVGQYESKGATVEMLEKLIGRPRSMGWTQQDRQRLLGIWNALKDGETSLAEVFADKPAVQLPTPTKDKPEMSGGKTTEEVNTELLDLARMDIAAATDEAGVDNAADPLYAKAENEATKSAIAVLVHDRKAALKQPKAGGKQKQGALV